MSHFPVSDPTFFSRLLAFDAEQARETLNQGCPHCGHATLHQANYPRKPRGVAPEDRKLFSFRFSFCCASCRRRTTCPSLRFLGRKLYIGLMVIMASCPQGRICAWFASVARETGISLRTLWRWRTFWTRTLPASRFWLTIRGRFMPPPEPRQMPACLLEVFQSTGDP